MAAARGSRTRPGRMPRAAGSPDLAVRSSQLDATRYDSARLGPIYRIKNMPPDKRQVTAYLDSRNPNAQKKYGSGAIFFTQIIVVVHL